MAGPAAAQPNHAIELHDEAQTLYAKGDYHQAAAKLREAVLLDPSAKLLHYNLGIIEERLGRLKSAQEHYETCLTLEQVPAEKHRLERIVERLKGARKRRVFEQGPGATIVFSGGKEAARSKQRPGRSARPSFPAVGTAFGVTAGVGLGTAIGLSVAAAFMDPGDSVSTANGVPIAELQREAERAHGVALAADIAYIVAAASGAALIVTTLVWAGSDGEPDETVTVGVAPFAGGGQVVARWQF